MPANDPRASVPLPVGPNRPHGESESEQAVEHREVAGAESRETSSGQAKVEPATQDDSHGGVEEWRDRALRLQADMENYRRRQQRSAQDQIRQERSRMLNAFLKIVDNLERALALPEGDGDSGHSDGLRRGVELTHRAAMQLLEKEGVAVVAAKGQAFDPNWYEAVATMPRNGREVAPGTVVEVVEPGYRIDEQLLRPAKVVVAV